jgi:hypothetical protein
MIGLFDVHHSCKRHAFDVRENGDGAYSRIPNFYCAMMAEIPSPGGNSPNRDGGLFGYSF